MNFTLNGYPVQEPQVMLSECQRLGFSTDKWLGKANSFVDRHGPDPSYGYFIIDHALKQNILQIVSDPNSGTSGAYTVTGGSQKATLRIYFDDGKPFRDIQLYVESIENITPSYDGAGSYYLVKLVDARFVFQQIEANDPGSYSYRQQGRWFNKVQTFLSARDLKDEFELEEEPDVGHFIYDELTVEDYHDDTPAQVKIGTRNGTDVKIFAPLSWEEVFRAIFLLFADTSRANIPPIFPHFEINEYELKLEFDNEGSKESMFPSWVPQDICLNYTSARDVLEKLLFWSGTSFYYVGKGKFRFFKVRNKDITANGEETNELDNALAPLGVATDIIHNYTETAQEYLPIAWALQFPILRDEVFDNTLEEYHCETFVPNEVDFDNKVLALGRRSHQLVPPIVWITERGKQYNQGDDLDLAEAEYWQNLITYFYQLYLTYFHFYPEVHETYIGYYDIRPDRYLERVSLYSLGNTPCTLIESIVTKDWNKFAPEPITVEEKKFSLILAKVDGEQADVTSEDKTFLFKEPKLLMGQLFPTNTAYNTHKRSYVDNEEIILIGGQFDKWRYGSLFIPDGYASDTLYYAIDDVPFLRLKVEKQHLINYSSTTYKWRVAIENVALVNGKVPRKDENLPDGEQTYLYIKNSPEILLDDDDEFIYIGYDLKAGDDVYHRWTVADPQNDLLFLKGLPGYVPNPEPVEGERRLVLKTPFSALEPIGWIEEAADGRTDQELEDFVINIIQEQGGGTGGGGGSTFILKGLINNPGGYASTAATVQWDGGTVLVSDGSLQPTDGAADNTFATPFLDDEQVLLIKKNNGVWTVIKIQDNLIKASPVNDVSATATTYDITLITTIQGVAPTGVIKGKGNGLEYMAGEPLIFALDNDKNWSIVSRLETTAIFRTIGTVQAASFNNTSGVLTIGSGSARKMTCNTANPNQYSVAAGEPNTTIKNMSKTPITTNKTIQCKKIGRHWFVDVEDCG